MGVVPVTTAVGSIPDFITDGKTGLFFSVRDADGLAEAIESLIVDDELYGRLRANVLEMRSTFGHDETIRMWSEWFREIS